MISLKQVRNLGGIGAVLVCLGVLPLVGGILSLVGVVLLLVSFYKLSELINNKDIFYKYLIGFLVGIAGIIVFLVSGIVSFLPSLFRRQTSAIYEGAILGVIIAILLWWILSIVSAHFYSQSYKLVGSYFNINTFNLAGNFVFWGAVTSIIVIGVILMFISNIILAVGLFSLPDNWEGSNNTNKEKIS